MQLGILVRRYDPRSAVGADIDGMKKAFTAAGHEVRIFASNGAESLDSFRIFANDKDATVIYHHAIAWPAGVRAFRKCRARRILRYHNVTPPRFFWRDSWMYVAGSLLGLWEARRLCETPLHTYVAASEFSALELSGYGASPDKCHVLRPYDHAYEGTDDATVAETLKNGAHVLHVGKLLPHKGQAHLIRAIAAWRERYQEPVHLWLVGGTDRRTPSYDARLHRMTRTLGVSDCVHFVGSATRDQLGTYFGHASVFAVASEHEGFCVPILEAMRHGTPVVGVARAAVAETIGSGGQILPTNDPVRLAAALHAAATDPKVREGLREAASARAGQMGRQKWADDLLTLLPLS